MADGGSDRNLPATDLQTIRTRAYIEVIRALIAGQPDGITWVQQSLLAQLRMDFEISSELHKEIIRKLTSDIQALMPGDQLPDADAVPMHEPDLTLSLRATPPTSIKEHVSSQALIPLTIQKPSSSTLHATRANRLAPLVKGPEVKNTTLVSQIPLEGDPDKVASLKKPKKKFKSLKSFYPPENTGEAPSSSQPDQETGGPSCIRDSVKAMIHSLKTPASTPTVYSTRSRAGEKKASRFAEHEKEGCQKMGEAPSSSQPEQETGGLCKSPDTQLEDPSCIRDSVRALIHSLKTPASTPIVYSTRSRAGEKKASRVAEHEKEGCQKTGEAPSSSQPEQQTGGPSIRDSVRGMIQSLKTPASTPPIVYTRSRAGKKKASSSQQVAEHQHQDDRHHSPSDGEGTDADGEGPLDGEGTDADGEGPLDGKSADVDDKGPSEGKG
ncbi:hypothetical protein GOP47_0001502 [Adiantum capillus-veneris]|uniref:ENT domain-containing protein n=1 Tax=Adiantum capillus-veneris TaxID=13818 RepID=A0A9D4ZNB2_ADICA|nr:hypothetical protein GOP47_0001502 [Adiantum capillus-veneris]